MLCYEDFQTNRTNESLGCFDEFVNSKWFIQTPFILLLNKADLLEHTMLRCTVSTMFPAFKGNNLDIDQVATFFVDRYLGRYRGEEKNKILPIMINTLDEEEVKNALRIIADVAIAGNTIGHQFEMWRPCRIFTIFTTETTTQCVKFSDVALNTV